jgi:hypothetical protein
MDRTDQISILFSKIIYSRIQGNKSLIKNLKNLILLQFDNKKIIIRGVTII